MSLQNKKTIEQVYYVTEFDRATGEIDEKYAAHHAETKLHAAFSCYVFNKKGQFLVTQRAARKKVWPTVWTNSCCGHPFPGETREDAIRRRLSYELGMTIKNIRLVLPRYIYKTPPYNGIVEHEFCPVYVAEADSEVTLNQEEVSDYKWVDWSWYVAELQKDSNDYSKPFAENAPKWSWWSKDQLKKLQDTLVFQDFLNSL